MKKILMNLLYLIYFISVLAVVCLMASCAEPSNDPAGTEPPSPSETNVHSAPGDTSGDTSGETLTETTAEEVTSSEEITSEAATDADKEHLFTLTMEETVYPTNFQSILFYVRSTKPGVVLRLAPQYFVYRVEGDREILVGYCGEEVLLEAEPVDENTYAGIDLSFTPKSLIMEDEFTAGTYRIYHTDDREVYVEFELRNE